jgi:hypothetical protein
MQGGPDFLIGPLDTLSNVIPKAGQYRPGRVRDRGFALHPSR